MFPFNQNKQAEKIAGEVVSIDENAMTCVIKPNEGAEMKDVMLSAHAFDGDFAGAVNVPSVGSMVVIDEFPHGFAVVQTSQLDRVIIKGNNLKWVFDVATGEVSMNDGNNGGVIIVQKLVQELEKINQFINIFKGVLSVPVPEAGNGANSSFQAALNLAYQAYTQPNYQDISNGKFRH